MWHTYLKILWILYVMQIDASTNKQQHIEYNIIKQWEKLCYTLGKLNPLKRGIQQLIINWIEFWCKRIVLMAVLYTLQFLTHKLDKWHANY